MIIRKHKRRQNSIPATSRIKPMVSILEVAGVFHEYTKGKTTDWDTIRNETMNTVAQEIESKTRT